MASITGIPEQPQASPAADARYDDTEPLLGRPGDASQRDRAPIAKNLIIGTGVIAEGAAVLLVASVWAAVFLHQPLILFSGHPLAQSLGLLVLVQGILVLQPTHTAQQKEAGQKIHAGLNFLAFALFIVGIVIIEVNKVRGNSPHFHSVHAYLGVISGIWMVLQYFIGFTMLGVPKLYGGEAKAKAMWKYHRMSGYFLLPLLMATTISATKTDYNKNVLGLKLWAMILIMVLMTVGIYPRIKKQKLGL